MRIRIDPDRCRCAAIAPELFDVDDYGTATARHEGDVPPDREQAARLAVRNCPEHAIGIITR
jgi:ferredoxin